VGSIPISSTTNPPHPPIPKLGRVDYENCCSAALISAVAVRPLSSISHNDCCVEGSRWLCAGISDTDSPTGSRSGKSGHGLNTNFLPTFCF